MKNNRYYLLPLIISVLILSSCDLLGIGGDSDDERDEEGPTLVWQAEAGGAIAPFSSPIINNSSVYLKGFNLVKLSLETGNELWKAPLDNSFTPNPGIGNVVLTENALVVAEPASVQSFSEDNGASLWKTSIRLLTSQEEPLEIANAGIPIAQTSSRIFVGGENILAGLNKSTGNVELEIKLDAITPTDEPQRVTFLAINGQLLFATTQFETKNQFQDGGNLIAINTADGKTRWTIGINEIAGDTSVNFAVARDLAFTNNQLIVLTSTEVISLDPETGNIRWQTSLGEGALIGSQLLSEESMIFVSAFPGTVLKLNTTNGSIEWQTSVGGDDTFGLSTGQMVFENRRIYYPFFSPAKKGIIIIDADNGVLEQTITGSDIGLDGFGFGFGLSVGIAAQDQFLIIQSALQTYGVEL